jgi:hypothetical protein
MTPSAMNDLWMDDKTSRTMFTLDEWVALMGTMSEGDGRWTMDDVITVH